VKKAETVNLGSELQADALRILRGIPGLNVVAEPGHPDRGIDFLLRFEGAEEPVAVEVKRLANAATAWQLIHYAAGHPGTSLLLIADQTTAEARDILEKHGVGVVDGLGNAHIQLPGLLVHLEARRRAQRQVGDLPPTRLAGKAGVAAQTLLLHPERAWRVQDLAKAADISTGLAHRVLGRLEAEGIVTAQGAGPARVRHVANPTALLDLWAEESRERRTRTLAHLLARSPAELIRGLSTNLGQSSIDHAVTGTAAASLLAPFVTAVPVVEVWVAARAAPEDLYDGAKADPVADGHNVVFLQAKDDTPLAFREVKDGRWLANRFRVYADLRRDPRRGREQADHLRAEVIGF